MSIPPGRIGNNQYPLASSTSSSHQQPAQQQQSQPQHQPHPPAYSSASYATQQQQQQQSQQGYPSQTYQQSPTLQGKPSDMVTLPPPHHVQQNMYSSQPYEYGQGQQPAPMGYPPQQNATSQQQPVAFNQPAPRQRTAIACRYCRRRKIRCYGFDTNPDGRCQNCSRFNQECVFTPVSSQAHAFVPAHTAYPQLRGPQGRYPPTQNAQVYPQPGVPGPPIYGPQGQPLGAVAAQQAHENQQHTQYPPAPAGPHQPYVQPVPYPSLPQPTSYDPRSAPPSHHQPADDHRRSSTGASYNIPPISPSSQTSYQSQPYPPGNYYAQQEQKPPAQRLPSPPNSYSYNDSRTSSSPHASAAPPPGSVGHYGVYPGGLHPPQALPPTNDRNSSPSGQSRGGPNTMSVAGMLGDPAQGSRSNTDNSMLNRLNQRVP